MTTRILERTAVQQRFESVSPSTSIIWDPVTDTGKIVFEVWDMVYEDGIYTGMLRNPEKPVIERTIEELSPRAVTVQTPAGPVEFPVLLVAGILKALFDELYNEAPAEVAPLAPRGVTQRRGGNNG